MNTLKFKEKPFNLFLWLAIPIASLSVFMNESMDVRIYDTYMIFSSFLFFLFFALLSVAIWLLYVLTFKFLYSRPLIWFHIIFTLIFFFFIVSTPFWFENFYSPLPRRYFDYGQFEDSSLFKRSATVLKVLIIAIIGGQLFYPINLLLGFLNRRNNRS